jgi:hypothetical protein
MGYAAVEIEKTVNHERQLFMLAGLRLVKGGALVWTASWIAPFDDDSPSRGT